MPNLRPNHHKRRARITGLVWGCPSVDQSSSRMAAACGPWAPPGGAQLFSSPCPSRSRRTHNLPSCSLVVATLCSLNGLYHPVSTRQSTPFGPGRARLTNESSPASCSHSLRRRGFRGPIRPVLRSIRPAAPLRKWQFSSAAADLGRITGYPEVMRQSKHCRAEPRTGFPLP